MVTAILLMITLIAAGFAYNLLTDVIEFKRLIKSKPESYNKERETALTARELEFFDCQLAILESIRNNAETVYKAAMEQVEHDQQLNQYCMVVPQKMVLKHIRDRDKAANALYNARNKIYNLELKKLKAENSLRG